MTIDEAIAKQKRALKFKREMWGKSVLREKNEHLLSQAKEHEQLAEWLEELKELRKIKEDYAKGMQTSYATFMYNKAIADFAERLCYKIKSEIDDCADELQWIDEIVEQLKAGETK